MRPSAGPRILVFLLALIALSVSWQAAFAACHFFSDLIRNGGYGVADHRGRIVSSCRPDTPFIPASVIKIPTALAALHILGREYRFRTEFFQDTQNNLYIKGYGDPLLTSEEVALILTRLGEHNVREINSIFIDDSAFALSRQTPGLGKSANPYDAPVGAVFVNFNTVDIIVDGDGKVRSGEEQTPTLPIMRSLALGQEHRLSSTQTSVVPTHYRVNICQNGCEPREQMARLTAELFRGLQQQSGIPGTGRWARKRVPPDARLVYTHQNSRDLGGVIASMLKFSSNVIANAVYLSCGANRFGYPATWEKAHRAVTEALQAELGADTAAAIIQKEGSGLSRDNRVTARAMLRVLHAFAPYKDLLDSRRGIFLKSGTLEGVYNYAGYLEDGRPFVILLNQQDNTRKTVLARLRQSQCN
ncbi:D-alanyl-D-alanine carboxypeptidase DacB [Desulfolithobacter dissulfuricans]|uniref:D-alanyl-D-alanine carboxypeptidase DacB n=1 Tax=Desulfolithobacter dissulfuricans TaxID=2795293 RepID=A0A915XL51_9BACT|nr:D-alanyl-D-alanine carboxypeptidase DacB [Desulfolithobacter dissulfuricans]